MSERVVLDINLTVSSILCLPADPAEMGSGHRVGLLEYNQFLSTFSWLTQSC